MTRKFLYLFVPVLIVLLANDFSVAQQAVITDIEDALLYNNTRSGQEQSRNVNYGGHIRNAALAWTNSGAPSYFRSVIRFELSSIPANAIVQSAVLYLYSDPTQTSGANSNSGSNAFYLEKVTQAWNEYTVNWNNQPPTTTVGRVWVGPSVSATENISMSLTALTQEWVSNPQSNYGVKMILENELYYRSRNYASSNHTNTSIRPKLIVTYQLPPPPVAPSGLVAHATSSSSISINWTDNSNDETSFQIERSSGSGYSLVHTTSPNVTTFVDTELASGVTYYYRVRAINSSGSSIYTNEASARTFYLPAAPSNLVLQVTSSSSITLTWADNSDNETSFHIERSLTSGAGYTLIQSTTANTITFTDSQLAPGTTYFYRVRAVNALEGSAYTNEESITTESLIPAALDVYAFQYRYDARNRMIMKKSPGAAWTYMVYDNRDRLVMTQDGNQRTQKKWTFTKYDALDRPILTGIYLDPEDRDLATMQNDVNDFYLGADPEGWYEERGSEVHGYTNRSFPSVNAAGEYLTVTYYDNYDFLSEISSAGEFEYDNGQLVAEGSYEAQPENANLRVRSRVTGAKVKNLHTNEWYYSVNYYDDYYHLIQTIAQNQRGGIDKSTMMYDFTGKVTRFKALHTVINQPEIAVTRNFEYDQAGRLLRTYHRVGNGPQVILSENRYNELGQLITKKLHSEDQGTTFQQHIDYRYNIRGWLTRINRADLTPDDPNETRDFFGMEFGYNNDLGIGSFTPQYNGNISATKWSANLGLALPYLNEPTERAYKFTYDPMNRLTDAKHATKAGTWSESKAHREIVNYDLNGNIQTLSRTNSKGGLMDWLVYNYGTGTSASNRLLSVTDNGIATEGFKDGNTVGNDYGYDANGNLTSDKNKKIGSFKYNTLNLTEEITKDNGEKVKYIYDADGIKLSELIYTSGSTSPKKRTDYVGPLVYENDTLKFIVHEEGKIVIPKDQSGPEYQYQIKDHLGNIRLTFTTKEKREVFKATMEDTGIADYNNPRVQEMQHFGNLFETEIRNVNQWLNHTSNATGNAIYLDGSEARTIGPYSILKVYPGDTVKMEVFAKFEKKSSYSSTPLVALLASLVTPIQTAVVSVDGAATVTSSSLMDGLIPLLSTKGSSSTVPAAYINYILFDKDFNVVDMGFDRIDGSAGFNPAQENTVAFDKLQLQRIIDRVGYIYVYVSNESEGTRVWMDDIKITYGQSPIVQFEDYYPFGLSHAGTAFERGNDKYTGMVTTDGTGLKDLGFRQYDAALGRFHAVDPLAELQSDNSTYQYAGNNPVNQIDVLGLEADDHDKEKNKPKPPKRDHHKKEQRVKEKHGYSRYKPENRHQRRNNGNNTQTARNRREKQDKGSDTSAKKKKDSSGENASASKSSGNANESGSSDPDPGQQALINALFSGPQLNGGREKSERGNDPINAFNNNQNNRQPRFENSVTPPRIEDDITTGTPSVVQSAALGETVTDLEQYREYLYRNHSNNEARALYARMLVSRNYNHQSNKLKDNVAAISNTLTNDDEVSKEGEEQLSRAQLKSNPSKYRPLTTALLRQKVQQQCPTCEQWKVNIAAGNALEYAWERMSGVKRNFGSKFWNNIRSKAVRPDFLYQKREHTTDENGKPDIFFYDNGVFVEVKVSQNTIDKETSNKQIWAELEVLSRNKDSRLNDILGETLGGIYGGKKAPDGVLTFLLVVTEGTVVDQSLIDQATEYGISFYISYAYENIQTGGVVFSTPEKKNFFGSAAGEGSQWDAIRHEGINQAQEGVPLELDRANKFIQHSNEYDETQP